MSTYKLLSVRQTAARQGGKEMNTVDKQFVSEYEEIFNRLGHHPKGIKIPATVHETYARINNEFNFFKEETK